MSYAARRGQTIAGGLLYEPSWAPAAGECKTISHALGAHPDGLAAVLKEVDPIYMAWNPDAPGHGPYGPEGYYFESINSYGGAVFNPDAWRIEIIGAGHAAINLGSIVAYELATRAWRWLDAPLPFDGLHGIVTAGYSVPPSQANVEAVYPPEQYNYTWGDINGDWSGWPAGFGRAGHIQPVPGHSRAGLAHVPAAVAGNAKGMMLYSVSPTGYLSGINAKASHNWDHDRERWRRHANQIPASASIGSNGRGIVVDPETKKAIAFGKGGMSSADYWVHDIPTETWSTRTASAGIALTTDHGGNVLHPQSRLMICPAGRTSAGAAPSGAGLTYTGTTYTFYAVPVDDVVGSGSFAPTALTVEVDSTWPLNDRGTNEFIGWAVCPANGCLYAINGVAGSNEYWELAPPPGAVTTGQYLSLPWRLTRRVFASGTLAGPTTRSFVYNRNGWDPRARAFMWFGDSVLSPVQAWRPEGL